jgi:hypothetical protein
MIATIILSVLCLLMFVVCLFLGYLLVTAKQMTEHSLECARNAEERCAASQRYISIKYDEYLPHYSADKLNAECDRIQWEKNKNKR